MRTVIINGFNRNNMCEITRAFFELRKRLFVDEMGWDIPNDGHIECDQYDHEESTYCIILDKNKVVAGARILPTTRNRDGWSYMIKDACEGKIAQIPSNLVELPPIQIGTYEITRFTVDPTFDADYRNEVLRELSLSSYQTVATLGGQYAIALMSPFFLRWFKQIGIAVEKLGPVVKGEESRYCVIGGYVENIAAARYVA